MMDIEYDLRERLTTVGRNLYDLGLTYGTAGNISARIPNTGTCLIKPSGFRFCDLEPEDFLLIEISTRKVLKGNNKPSSETPFHTKLYIHWPSAGGVVHLHPKYSTILSILGEEVIPMEFTIYQAPALAKGIPVSKYAPLGTEELADNLVDAMKKHVACLMPHHGSTTIGKTIEEASQNAIVLEKLAQFQYELMLVGKPEPIPQSMRESLIERAKKRGLLI
jgi:L-fuculose-phosphate aldolase